MAEESPLMPSSDTSALSHKRRITDVVSSLDHHACESSEKPFLSLSPISSSSPLEDVKTLTLEVRPTTDAQETLFTPEQSPKKAKFSPQNLPLSDEIEVLQASEKAGLNLDGELEEGGKSSKIEELGAEASKEGLNLDGKKEVSEFELEKKIKGSEKNEVIDEFLGAKDEHSSEIVESEKRAENNNNNNGFVRKMMKKEDLTTSLKIEVVDGTAVVDFSKVEGKKIGRRGKKGIPKSTVFVADVSNGGRRKFLYSRKHMEVLRFVNVKGQRKFWEEIYNGFSGTVKEEYDDLGSFRHHKNGGSISRPHKNEGSISNYQQNGGKKYSKDGGILSTFSTVSNYNDRGILGESCSGNVSCDAENVSSANFTYDGDNSGKDGEELVGEWSEDEESDDEYENIQRPAFKVEGEPDFESGPPEDGLEYLRRVRWEAKQIPKVKVVKLNNIKLKDQSVYMPKIPDIEECPSHLMPLRHWEDEFIADFAELRRALSCVYDTSDAVSFNSESVIFSHCEHKSHLSKNLASLKLTSGAPTLSTVLAMDPVARVATLRKRIKLFESSSDVLKEDCAWLFALCAVVDTPLHADTLASLRCLLRRCAQLRALKAEIDDEVVMLNVLATISGLFFGQSGN